MSDVTLTIAHPSAELVYNWRQKIIDLLSTPIDPDPPAEELSSAEIKPETEYYAVALQAQGDLEAYLIAYAAALADRKGKLRSTCTACRTLT